MTFRVVIETETGEGMAGENASFQELAELLANHLGRTIECWGTFVDEAESHPDAVAKALALPRSQQGSRRLVNDPRASASASEVL
jgi:hypothetical protein